MTVQSPSSRGKLETVKAAVRILTRYQITRRRGVVAEGVGGRVVRMWMDDRGGRQRVPGRMAEPVGQRGRQWYRGPRRHRRSRGRRHAALFRALGQGRRGAAVRP